jgi:hypothetical protein
VLPAAAPSLLTACNPNALTAMLLRSDSPWAKASAVSYDVVAMERWMNVLLAQRLDGSRIKLEHAQRRIDQAISEELQVVTSAGEVRIFQPRYTTTRVAYTRLYVTAFTREPRQVEAAESGTRSNSCKTATP